jgi:phosphoglycolate phosphatase
MKVGILFDLDGTLLDTLGDLTDATNYALRHHGYPERTIGEIRTFVGNGAANQIRLCGPAGVDYEEVLATYKPYYDTHCQIKTAPYPGILQALEELQDYPMAVVSNKPHSAVTVLSKQYFGDIYARGEQSDCPRKPEPDMVYRTMEALGVEKCVYVGDSEVDVRTAKNAGVPCLSVLWGFRDREVLEAEGAEFFCNDPKNLANDIKKIIESM